LTDRVVVVGAGAAGLAAVDGLRSGGYEGEVMLIGEEIGMPYDRPPLSKQILAGTWDAGRANLMGDADFERLRPIFHDGIRVAALDQSARTVATDDGRTIEYTELVIATGVSPISLGMIGVEGVHTLRTLADAHSLRDALDGCRSLVVVGGGFLGAEVAATARGLGVPVTLIELSATPLAAVLGTHVAKRVVDLHVSHGVNVLAGHAVRGVITQDENVLTGVELDDGRVDADVALVAVGCRPEVGWLATSGLPVEDGVLCDGDGRAAPGIWAAGDVASWRRPDGDGRVRREHRLNASQHGRSVGLSIAGAPAPAPQAPFFWTDHYDARIQVVGELGADDSLRAVHGDPDSDSFVLASFHDETMTGVIGWNAAKVMTGYRRELNQQLSEQAQTGEPAA
jgi:3-phenylpropionate/trans-cinnamate dioxygenase ferredoxin reductase component